MRVRDVGDPVEFRAVTHALLMRDEARNNLALGLTDTLVHRPRVYPGYRLWTVERDRKVVAAALRTPPFNLVLPAPADAGAYPALAHALAARGEDLPGVVGAEPEAGTFVAAWAAETGAVGRVVMAERIYRLSRVHPQAAPPGRMRGATADDRDLLIRWMDDFTREALPEGAPMEPERFVDLRLEGGTAGLVLWEDGEEVAVAGYGGPTPTGIRIGPVYTPPDRRRRGYAAALVAALSQRMLDEGRRFCFLYTDLANPTSNAIYRRIGYEPVCDANEYRFEDRSERR